MGLEPTTFGTTIRRSNQLSYVHHVRHFLSNAGAKIIAILFLCKILRKKRAILFSRPASLSLDNSCRGDAVTALDELAQGEHAAQVNVIVQQQDVGILASLK